MLLNKETKASPRDAKAFILNCDIVESLSSSRSITFIFRFLHLDGPGDQGTIPVIPKTQKMVLDAALLSTQLYKVRIKGEVYQSWEWSSALPYTSV